MSAEAFVVMREDGCVWLLDKRPLAESAAKPCEFHFTVGQAKAIGGALLSATETVSVRTIISLDGEVIGQQVPA